MEVIEPTRTKPGVLGLAVLKPQVLKTQVPGLLALFRTYKTCIKSTMVKSSAVVFTAAEVSLATIPWR